MTPATATRPDRPVTPATAARRILVPTVVVLVALALGSTAASAAWSPTGSGTGTAAGRPLGVPTAVAASALTYSSVRITWAPPATDPAPTQYVVHRTAPDAATVCAVTAPTTQCDDLGLSASTTYTYTVESRLGTNWTSGASTPASTTTPAGPNFLVTATAGSKTAGTAFTVTITATTNGVTTDTTYTGSKIVTFSGPASAPGGTAPTYPASVTFAAGVGSASVTLFNAAPTTLTAVEGVRTGSVALTVVAGAAKQLRYTSSSASCASGSVHVGVGGTFTSKVTTYDAYLNPKTGSRTVSLSRSPVQGTLSPTSLTIAAASSETTGSFSLTIPTGSPPATTVTATSGSLTAAACAVSP